jgi:hypothetical protein
MTEEGRTRFFNFAGAGFLVAAVFGLIYLDVVSRAKESFLKGELYLDWAAHPEKKKSTLQSRFESDKAQLEKRRSEHKISDDEFQRQLDALTFDLDQAFQESSSKYAYQWYKDTFELFTPPESKWAAMARIKAPVALELWKKELDEKKIPYTDTMFE